MWRIAYHVQCTVMSGATITLLTRRSALCTVLMLAIFSSCDPSSDILDIVENPENTLSCRVRWSTHVPALSEVRFQEEDGGPWYAVDGGAETTEHDVLVLGLRPATDYRLLAVSTTTDGRELLSEETRFTSGELPFTPLINDIQVLDPVRMMPGWTLMNLVIDDLSPPTLAVMLDEVGEIVWYHGLGPSEGFSGVQTSWVDGVHVLIGGNIAAGESPTRVDLAGNVIWQGPRQPDNGVAGDGTMHHTFQALPNGHYVTLFLEMAQDIPTDTIWELDSDLETAWLWRSKDHLPESTESYLHGNMVQVDLDEDVVYYNARDASTLYKVDRATGEVLWRLAEDQDFEMLGDHSSPWFGHAHAPSLLPDGHLLVHDNGHADRLWSRVVEYELDQLAMTIRPVWQYPEEGSNDLGLCHAWGDADRLANGNTLITTGSCFEGDSQPHLVEVTPAGDVVWEVWLEAEGGGLAGAYMAERIDSPVRMVQ